jgi:TolB-like protein/DNA-binding winged helix-turn-helix (wHTH) protein/Tfp pilus assembly protein PilF
VRERGSYGFGRFQMDAARRTLTRDGAAVALTPTLFDTLMYLVENPARVVTKEELLSAIWPRRFVDESNLTQAIFMLRKALRNAGDDGRLIVTAPGQGYRFTAEVRVVTGSAPALEPKDATDGSPESVHAPGADEVRGPTPPWIDRRAALIGGAVFAVAATGAGSWLWWRGPARIALADKSIVVLPFANLSGDPDQAYLSDGITEEVRTTLTTIQGLRVIGRVSSAQVRDMSSQDILAKLGVGAILTGSVRRSPTAIRVSAQLIDAARGDQRWAEDYDRAPGDAMLIEDSIAKGVAGALEARLGPNEAFVGTGDPEAHDLYLKARALEWGDSGLARLQKALELIDTALRIDPRYVKAHAARSGYLADLANFAVDSADERRLFAEAGQSARRCVALAPQWNVSHERLADSLTSQFDYRGALNEYRKAQRLDPNYVSRGLPFFLAAIGRRQEAVAAEATVVPQDPLDPSAWLQQGYIAYSTRQYEEALALARKTSVWAPKLETLKFLAARALLCLGRPREALDEVSAMNDDSQYGVCTRAIASWRLGDRHASDEALARLKQLAGDTVNCWLAAIHAQRSEIEAAFASLEEAWRVRDGQLLTLPSAPLLDPIRNEPRFKALLAKLDFP